ncbi:MAG TPA: hypothetical protein VNN73_14590 [Blastocatellia bacterium]|nr:hypothetical protein [Blastocatellia bacterium]
MTALLAMGIGLLMAAVGVAIGGLALELVMIVLSRSLAPVHSAKIEQARKAVLIRFKNSDNATGTAELAEEAA